MFMFYINRIVEQFNVYSFMMGVLSIIIPVLSVIYFPHMYYLVPIIFLFMYFSFIYYAWNRVKVTSKKKVFLYQAVLLPGVHFGTAYGVMMIFAYYGIVQHYALEQALGMSFYFSIVSLYRIIK